LDVVGCCFALLRRVCWPRLEECFDLGPFHHGAKKIKNKNKKNKIKNKIK
jgi:hypothetical protein